MRTLLLLALLPLGVNAQDINPTKGDFNLGDYQLESNNKAFYYVFQQSTSTYSDLTNADFTLNGTWDDPEITVETPFGTDYLGVQTDSMQMGLGSMMVGLNYSNGDALILSPVTADLIDLDGLGGGTGQSPISYKVEGTSPNRIFKMEWKNAGFYIEGDYAGALTSSANIQLWLYEDETVEFHFGPSNLSTELVDSLLVNDELVSVATEIDFITEAFFNSHFITGNPSTAALSDSYGSLTAWPANGTVYTLGKSGIGFDEQTQPLLVELYPNPATSELRVRCEDGKSFAVELIDLSGQVVRRGTINATDAMSLNGISSGLYLTKITDVKTGEIVTRRLVVK
ncbi:MAG: T9SS type A sorting domain-containing protein [Bacteroidetes bacterium]|nr:MAG: T9SS type A sorting domain-containing protein [Bacteroidota bacterium]